MIGAIDGFIQNGRNKFRNYSLHIVFKIESNKRSIYMFFLKLNLPQRRADLITAFSQHSCYRIKSRRNKPCLERPSQGVTFADYFLSFCMFWLQKQGICGTNAHVCKKKIWNALDLINGMMASETLILLTDGNSSVFTGLMLQTLQRNIVFIPSRLKLLAFARTQV
jgi:hypothetical protein